MAAAGAAGLTVLSKETSIVLLVAMFAFLALSPEITRAVPGRRDLARRLRDGAPPVPADHRAGGQEHRPARAT